MNEYSVEFFSTCPVNGVRIKYLLRIETPRVIRVEHLLATLPEGPSYHEAIADHMHEAWGGKQTITAHHHGVDIRTTRDGNPHRGTHWLDQSVGGMAGTPGY
jgi:hypothetical protein